MISFSVAYYDPWWLLIISMILRVKIATLFVYMWTAYDEGGKVQAHNYISEIIPTASNKWQPLTYRTVSVGRLWTDPIRSDPWNKKKIVLVASPKL